MALYKRFLLTYLLTKEGSQPMNWIELNWTDLQFVTNNMACNWVELFKSVRLSSVQFVRCELPLTDCNLRPRWHHINCTAELNWTRLLNTWKTADQCETFISHKLEFANYATYFAVSAANQCEVCWCDVRMTAHNQLTLGVTGSAWLGQFTSV